MILYPATLNLLEIAAIQKPQVSLSHCATHQQDLPLPGKSHPSTSILPPA
ncbi:hypothetical protein NIES3974_36670 [Calothrix sp. NIES-3974]|nr:hypothetical protein NIES3974_36670 [Calothrix sp. NIES-3974]